MSRINAIFVLFAFSSICFGGLLMQVFAVRHSTRADPQDERAMQECLPEAECDHLADIAPGSTKIDVARALYRKAYSASFAGRWQEARDASICAAKIMYDTTRWNIEPIDLIR